MVDTGDVGTLKSGYADCDVVVRFYEQGFAGDDRDGDGTRRIFSSEPAPAAVLDFAFTLDTEGHSFPTGIAYAGDFFYVVYGRDEVHAYDSAGERESSRDFPLDAENASAVGIVYADGFFYVVDSSENKVFAYDESGGRAASRDFPLGFVHRGHKIGGIAYADGFFYVMDGSDWVSAYDGNGGRAVSRDFFLDPGVSEWNQPVEITYAEGLFYVLVGPYSYPRVDAYENHIYQVHAYDGSGKRAALRDGQLLWSYPDGEEYFPRGFVYSDGLFYIVGVAEDTLGLWTVSVWESDPMWRRTSSRDFRLEAGGYDPWWFSGRRFDKAGIAYVDGFVYVVNGYHGKVYAYDATGKRASGRDFRLDLHPGYLAVGMTHDDDVFYVVAVREDYSAYDAVLVYERNGTPLPSRDFALEWRGPRGIAYADGFLYVWYHGGGRAYRNTQLAYDSRTGERAPERDSTTPGFYYWDDRGVTGIVYAEEDWLFSVHHSGGVSAYRVSGSGSERHLVGERYFPLVLENRNVGGIAYGDGRFYVVDLYANAVFVYRWMGRWPPVPVD